MNKQNLRSENFFNLDSPEDYYCSLLSFTVRLKHALVSVRHKTTDKKYQIYLPLINYFEGPTSWEGANFCIAGQDEYQELLEKLGRDITTYSEGWLLLVVQTTSNFRVRVLTDTPQIEVVPPFVRPET